jgi:hypothetical protein
MNKGLSEACTVFCTSNVAIMVSNPKPGMDICLRSFVLVSACVGRGIVKTLSAVQRIVMSIINIPKPGKGGGGVGSYWYVVPYRE